MNNEREKKTLMTQGLFGRVIKLKFLVFKRPYTHFHTHFHSHVFQKTTNNITKTPLSNKPLETQIILLSYLMLIRETTQRYINQNNMTKKSTNLTNLMLAKKKEAIVLICFWQLPKIIINLHYQKNVRPRQHHTQQPVQNVHKIPANNHKYTWPHNDTTQKRKKLIIIRTHPAQKSKKEKSF